MANIPPFKPTATIERFLEHCHRRQYPAKSLIIYAGDKPDGFVGGHRWGGLNWEKGDIDALPDRETLLAIQAEVQQYASEQLRALSDGTLLDGENLFPWTGATPLERVIYMIRHSQQHLGEFNNELTRRGHKPAEWR